MEKLIAVTHPGKIGDALYALPTARFLAHHYQCKVDFYTSEYCKAMTSIVEAQPYINKVVIPDDYHVEKMDCGIQPWIMPTNGSYIGVYHCGFRNVPTTALPVYIAQSIGLPKPEQIGNTIDYKFFSDIPEKLKDKKYIVVAPRCPTTFEKIFLDFIDNSPFESVVIGGPGEYIGKGIDCTDLNFEEMTAVIANSIGFVGIMSSPLIIANGFDITKVIIHDGLHWDMRHVVHSRYTNYLINPSGIEVANHFK